MSNKGLPNYVSEEVMTAAGFNAYGPSLLLDIKEKGYGGADRVYLSHMENKNLNVVIVEARRDDEKRRRLDWYFGTFEGPDSSERSGKAVDEYLESVRDVIARKNRIAGKDLQNAILRLMEA